MNDYQRTRAGRIRTVKFTLPAHWASVLINGDESGLDESESKELEAWEASHPECGACLDCSREPEFRWRNDAGTLAGDCLEYVFPLRERVATLKPMRREVCRPGQNARKPAYQWVPGYIVSFEGRDVYPPVSRIEAYDVARELGATRITVA